MVLHARHAGSSYVLSVKPHSIAVSLDDETVASWDRGGRLYSAYRGGDTWRRGLNGAVIATLYAGDGRSRRVLGPAEAAAIVDDAAGVARRMAAAMGHAGWIWQDRVDAATQHEARTLLDLCGGFDAAAARDDARRFAGVYRPIGILPPDQYLSLVLQATEGCSFNTCTFCDLYHEPYRVRTPDAFRAHISSVFDYLGESRLLRSRGVFLGAANAMAIPMARLAPIFEAIVEEADGLRLGVSAFADGFTGQMKTPGDYRALGDMGLRRVYIGLESGHDPLLAFVRKPGSAAAAVETVRRIKEGGVSVGVIVMTGLGGQRFSDGHVADTIAALSGMALGAGDLLYFSEFLEIAGTAYPLIAAGASIVPIAPEARRAQREAILGGVRFAGPGPRVATYDVREFVY